FAAQTLFLSFICSLFFSIFIFFSFNLQKNYEQKSKPRCLPFQAAVVVVDQVPLRLSLAGAASADCFFPSRRRGSKPSSDVVAAVSSPPPIFLSLVRRLPPSFRSDAAAEHAAAAVICFRRRRSISSPGRRSPPEFLPFAPEKQKGRGLASGAPLIHILSIY
ncbi:hypothetical protein LINPERPRIM_LOCUS23948, partial [Linum perenne]